VRRPDTCRPPQVLQKTIPLDEAAKIAKRIGLPPP